MSKCLYLCWLVTAFAQFENIGSQLLKKSKKDAKLKRDAKS